MRHTGSSVAQLNISTDQIPMGLTTTEAPFIEVAREQGALYIQQPYELYSDSNHLAWAHLYERMHDRWLTYANQHFLKGIESLCLDPTRVPRLSDVNRFLEPLTHFSAKPVSGYVPAFKFFDCLRNREFPTTITVRRLDQLDYLILRLRMPSFDLGIAPTPQQNWRLQSPTNKSECAGSRASFGPWPASFGSPSNLGS